jgi:DNA-binding NarL/FixJ family response regulator
VGADNEDHELLAFIEAGARAYTSSSASLDELVSTIKAVEREESPCSGHLGALVAVRIAALAKAQRNSAQSGLLTAREHEILRLVAVGLSNKEIGQQLSISLHTVKIHVHRILEKLQVRRRRDAARWLSSPWVSSRTAGGGNSDTQ